MGGVAGLADKPHVLHNTPSHIKNECTPKVIGTWAHARLGHAALSQGRTYRGDGMVPYDHMLVVRGPAA